MLPDASAPPADALTAPGRRQSPSLLAANLCLLGGSAVVLLSGWVVRGRLSAYLVGILAELSLALMALLFLALERLPVRATLRLRVPRWEALAAAPGLALGFWMISIGVNFITALILGYTAPVAPDSFPTTPQGALLMVVLAVVIAPLCEEIMFRGYIQRAYESYAPWIGIVVGGLIFALYHLRFQGLAALLPVSMLLGLLAWRTESLWPSVLLHSLFNGFATAVLLVLSFVPPGLSYALLAGLLCLGVLVVVPALATLWSLWRRLPAPPRRERPVLQRRVWRWVWLLPLIVMAAIYGVFAVLELRVAASARFQEPVALDLAAQQDWAEPGRWVYTAQDRLGRSVGCVTCTQSLTGDAIRIACISDLDADAAELPNPWPVLNRPTGPVEQWQGRVAWASDTLELLELSASRTITDLTTSVTLSPAEAPGAFRAVSGDASYTADLVPGALVQPEWPWRLSGLPFAVGYAAQSKLLMVTPEGALAWVHASIVVRGGEPVWTPGGTYAAWRVDLRYVDDEGSSHTISAWYDAEAPHRLVRYDDAVLQYLLSE